MNIALWILQIALAFLCVSGGIFQIFKLDELKKGVAAMRALPRGLWMFLGAFGCVGGLLLIVPGVMRWLPGLTPLAAAAVALQSALISGFYLRYRDRAPLPYSLTMVMLAVLICYARLSLQPL
jgi:hypothetical protein